MNQILESQDTPYLALTSKLWDVYCEDLGENWPHYNGRALYVSFKVPIPIKGIYLKFVHLFWYKFVHFKLLRQWFEICIFILWYDVPIIWYVCYMPWQSPFCIVEFTILKTKFQSYIMTEMFYIFIENFYLYSRRFYVMVHAMVQCQLCNKPLP